MAFLISVAAYSSTSGSLWRSGVASWKVGMPYSRSRRLAMMPLPISEPSQVVLFCTAQQPSTQKSSSMEMPASASGIGQTSPEMPYSWATSR